MSLTLLVVIENSLVSSWCHVVFVVCFIIFRLSLLKCGLTAPKSPKLVIFGMNLPKRGIPA